MNLDMSQAKGGPIFDAALSSPSTTTTIPSASIIRETVTATTTSTAAPNPASLQEQK
jgi:hypothetical protein